MRAFLNATIILLILAAAASFACAFDLKDYPKPMFIDEGGNFNGLLVVGKAAASSDVIGLADIKASLQRDSVQYHRNKITGLVTLEVNIIPVTAVKLDSDIDDPDHQAMIVVGGPCTNSIAARLLGYPRNCAEGFEEGRAVIRVFDNNGNPAILVAGMTKKDTMRATTVLANHREFGLSGQELVVSSQTLKELTIA